MSGVLHYSDTDVGIATWRNVQVNVFTRQVQAQHLAELRKVRQLLLVQYPAGVFSLTLAEPTALSIPPDLRQSIVALMHEMSKSTLAGCFVFAGGGITMTSIRTVVSAMILASRPARPVKAFPDLHAASTWLCTQLTGRSELKEPYTAEVLLDALRAIERLHLQRQSGKS